MNINTEDNFVGVDKKSPMARQWILLKYEDDSTSSIPHGFFRDWMDQDLIDHDIGNFFIGRCSGLGVGSIAKYDSNRQSLKIGSFVAGGLRLKFLLNGQHDMECISTYMFSLLGSGFTNTSIPQYKDTVIKNDVWIGDEALFLGGSTVENGCVIGARTVVPPNFKSEPYGIYVGSPAKLVRFRFSERIRECLLQLAWWDMPIEWLRGVNDKFLINLTKIPEDTAVDILKDLISQKDKFLKNKEKA